MIVAELDFKEKVDLLRKRLGLTVSKLASMVGVSPGYMGQICAGYINPESISEELKSKIAEALGCSKAEIFQEMVIAFNRYTEAINEFKRSFKPIEDMIKRAGIEMKKIIPSKHLNQFKRIQKEWKKNRKFVR